MQAGSTENFRELTGGECLELLTTVEMGYLAVTYRALPAVVPVHIHLEGNDIVIGSLLGPTVPLQAGSVVALEAGTLGQEVVRQWTVAVRGFLRANSSDPSTVIESESELFRLSAEMIDGWEHGTLNERQAGRHVLGPERAVAG